MTETVRVPDPVFDRITREADNEDVPNGIIVKEWMEKADKFDEREVKNGR